jgi:outer membrane autotransporter protein
MKKLVIATILASTVGLAQAADVTVRTGHNGLTAQNYVGVAVGLAKSGPLGLEVGADRSTSGSQNVNRFSTAVTADVAKVFGATVTARLGGAYLDRATNQSGLAAMAGVGVAYPLSKTMAVVADYTYQYAGEASVSNLNGGITSVGLRVSF